MRDMAAIWQPRLRLNLNHLLLLGGLCCILVFMLILPAQRVGDGSEYYAMYLSWQETLRPYMTETAYQAYAKFMASGQVPGLVSRTQLENAFPALRLGTTSDFNHFWLFSFLAFVIGKLTSLLQIGIQLHTGFILLHFILLSTTILLAYRFYKWPGVTTVLIMTFASPMFWFIDKAHTEFFTYCLVLSSIILLLQERFFPAAFFQALAATQNPSFAIIAAFILLLSLVRQPGRSYGLFELILAGAIGLLVLLHPSYYFFRFGVATPQLLAGGASLGGNLSSFHVWLLDLDIGLLPNWPIGTLSLLLAALFFLSAPRSFIWSKQKLGIAAFILFYLLINLYAHSSTTNINSGATPGLSRYSLWYLPLAFPFFIYVIVKLSERLVAASAAAMAFCALAMLSLYQNVPIRSESYTKPAYLSMLVQSRLPWFYNPPHEVFLERYTPFGEAVHLHAMLMAVGPDCKKALVIPFGDRQTVTSPTHCFLDNQKLKAIASELIGKMKRPDYISLSTEQVKSARLTINTGQRYKVGMDQPGNFLLRSGWSGIEPWGVWSEGAQAAIALPCDDDRFNAKEMFLGFRVFEKQTLTVKEANGAVLWSGQVAGAAASVKFDMRRENCQSGQYLILLDISNPTSPSELGPSNDRRKLGIGLVEMMIGNTL
ncbi:hypothetical protein V6B08_00080 [Ferrovibrio sp. MS7]|uniref:hypothetical protein n=1 Tax=Ferrovibrio plantarum TaxID=3119164 RepID=UPI0031367168